METDAQVLERNVFYKHINKIPYKKMDSETSFYVGRIIGMMQAEFNRLTDKDGVFEVRRKADK